MHKDETIIVEIAAFCDPDLMTTIKSALKQADNPDRVHFAICYQSDDEKELKELQKIKNCRIKHLKKSEARGSCYARYLCQKLIEDEEYALQIDAHMRFCKHWDTKTIELLLSLGDPKALISYYPPQLTEEMEKLPYDDVAYDGPSAKISGAMSARRFQSQNSNFLEFRSSYLKQNDKIKRSPFIAAGYIFTFAKLHKNVLVNPEMYYLGDELPMAIRYYTHGWNNYCPNRCYIYHKYLRKDRAVPNNGSEKARIENELFNKLLYSKPGDQELGEFGLGKERTVKQFEDYAGVDFTKKIIYESAETGEYNPETISKKASFIQYNSYKQREHINKKEKIQVLIVDLFSEYEKCIKSCINSHTKNEIEIVIGTKKGEKIDQITTEQYHIKKIEYFEKDAHYSAMLAKLYEHITDGYVLIIDSSVRFLEGWDESLCESAKMCGENTALTSWLWYTQNNAVNLTPYVNRAKAFRGYKDYMPILEQKDTRILRERIYPCQTAFITDGLLFCHSKILKRLPLDPNLSYSEQMYMYSVRLWTTGINIYCPKASHFYRTKDEKSLDSGIMHKEVICGLMNIYNEYSKKLPDDYKYTLGNKRSLWSWYDYIGYDYQSDPEYYK